MKTLRTYFAMLALFGFTWQAALAQSTPQTGGAQGYFQQFGDLTPAPAVIPAAMDCTGPECQAIGSVPTPEILSSSGACDLGGAGCSAGLAPMEMGEVIDCDSACFQECDAWAHFTSIYGGLLYLRPRNADVAYGVPIDGPVDAIPGNNPIQIGPVGMIDPDYDLGFQVGANLAINAMSSIVVDLMMFDGKTSSQIETAPPDVIRSLVSHPSSTSAATDFLAAQADLEVQLDTFDLGLRHLFVGGQVFAVNYSVAARYARLEQAFGSQFINNGEELVHTDIDFDGVGLRLGVDAERHACGRPWRLYGRCAASFLAGKFQASYFQGQSFDPNVVDTSWEAGRIVPVLDLELGAGWSSPAGRVQLTAGYVFSAWLNTVTTQEFIHAVQQNDFLDLGDSLTFDGLVARAELRF
jgi:hypothetical protein